MAPSLDIGFNRSHPCKGIRFNTSRLCASSVPDTYEKNCAAHFSAAMEALATAWISVRCTTGAQVTVMPVMPCFTDKDLSRSRQ